MTSHALSQVRNFHACNAGVPPSLEIEAVIAEITDGWDLGSHCTTAREGVSEADRESIRELIVSEALTISPEAAVRALQRHCKGHVLGLIELAGDHNRLDSVVRAYLLAIGQEELSRGESYEETAARLDDDIVRAAAARWWELEE